MKRIAVALAAAAALAGCGDGSSSSRSVLLYWSFQRNTLPPAPAAPLYDAVDPADGLDGPCAQSGVDYVVVTDEGGRVVNPELPQVPCKLAGVHGVQINGVRRGARAWTLTGYRNDGLPLFVGTTSFDLGRSAEIETVLGGIPDDLDVNVAFNGPRGGALAAQTCAANGVGFLAYNLFDGAGTLVATGDVPCPNPPGLTFRVATGTGVDRDTYTARIQGFRDQASTTPLFDDQTTKLFPECQASSFDHVGTDVAQLAWRVELYDVASDPAQVLCR